MKTTGLYSLSVLLLLLCNTITNAQKWPNTLLWRIDGNGLSKPSYLYGTMHLTDERIFNLGDSLFAAIENSDGLAIELDPKVFTGMVIEEVENSYTHSQNLEDILTEEQVKKYIKKLSKKIGKPEEKLTTKDILLEKNKRLLKDLQSEKMQTFLDAYLYDAARRLGKWTGGIEDADDQRNLLNDMIDESDIIQLALDDNGDNTTNIDYKELIDLYSNQDLTGILDFTQSKDSVWNEKLLTIRNKKMALRMDSLAHQRSMVFAVGAAHLPGNDGLITLLKQRGYKVTPVFSSKKIKASDYKLPELQTKQYPVTDKDSNYTVLMPGEAESLTFFGIMDMRIFYDVFNGTVYMTGAIPNYSMTNTTDSVLNYLSKYYFHTKYKQGKSIILNNTQGRAFTDTSTYKYSRGYLLNGRGMIYVALAVAEKYSALNKSQMDTFLKSFSIIEKDTIQKIDSKTAYHFIDTIQAYSLTLPKEPTPFKNTSELESDKSTKTKLYSSFDMAQQTFYIFGTSTAMPGYYIDDYNSNIQQIKNSLKQKLKKVEVDTSYFLNGQHVTELSGVANNANISTRIKYIYRNNRWYELIAAYEKKNKHSTDRFFDSFKMLDYPKTEWHFAVSADSSFRTWSPGKIALFNDDNEEENNTTQYIAFDTLSAATYSIMEKPFSKYYWQPNDSALFEDLASWAVEYPYMDSLISKKQVQNNGVKGIETLVKRDGSSNYRRSRYIVSGNKLYRLFTITSDNEQDNKDINKFFEEFKLKKKIPNDIIYKSKSKELVADLIGSDSTQKVAAINYLRTGVFTKQDLPVLHNALLKSYDTSEYGMGFQIRYNLVTAILDIKDSSSFLFAKEQYNKVPAENRSLLLSLMIKYPSEAHFRSIANLATNNPPSRKTDYRFQGGLIDSLPLTSKVIDDFLPLLKVPTLQEDIIITIHHLAEEGLLQTEKMRPYQDEIYKIAQHELDSIKRDSTNMNYSSIYSIIPILSWLNTEKSNGILLDFASLKHSNYLKLNAVNGLIQNGQTVPLNVIKTLAADVYTRKELYDTLGRYNKIDLFPTTYKSQLHFAESYVYYTAADDDDEPSKVEFIEKKILDYKGKKAIFYFYKVSYEYESEESYLSCAGPFDTDKQILFNDATRAEMYFDKTFEPESLDEQQKALFEQIKSNDEASDKGVE